MPGVQKLSAVQAAKLDELVRVKTRRDNFLNDVQERQRVERELAVGEFEKELSQLANDCRDSGIVHRRIQSVLGLQNWDSYKKLRDLTLGSIALRKEAEEQKAADSVFKIVREIAVGDGTYHYEVSVEGQTHTSYVRMGGTGNVWVEDVDDESLSRPLRDWYRETSGKGNPEK